MKKYEIKKIGPFSFFKAFFYVLLLPLTIYLLFGTVVLVTGVVTNDEFYISDGLSCFLNAVIAMFVYGLISLLTPGIYNFLAGRFGGLQFTLEEKRDNCRES